MSTPETILNVGDGAGGEPPGWTAWAVFRRTPRSGKWGICAGTVRSTRAEAITAYCEAWRLVRIEYDRQRQQGEVRAFPCKLVPDFSAVREGGSDVHS